MEIRSAHHRPRNTAEVAVKSEWPLTVEGGNLAGEVRDSKTCTDETKAKLIREVLEHEATRGRCTQTFIKKIRKQIRPATP